jgi:pimeloyl-ACP methyl ester carboxylesterase
MRQVLILHGWSDTSASFHTLAAALRSNGYQTTPVWLGDYISKDDDVSIPDVAKRMEEVLQQLVTAGSVATPFDMIVHSTGGLVARTWLTMFDASRGSRWMQRLVMLAPANYGSRLASMGKSMVGRLTKGMDNWFQTGTQMLNALELGSPFQWRLALADVLHDGQMPSASLVPYSEAGCLPFVISGIKGYDQILRRPLNENGADGTVRAAAANLTSYGLTLDFTRGTAPAATLWNRVGPLDQFAYHALDDVDHGSIIEGGPSVLPLVLEALACPMDRQAYTAILDRWFEATDALADPKDPAHHQFFQLNTFVVDDLGDPVADHFIEFYGSDDDTRDAALAVFQTDVIRDVHVNGVNGACRTFFIDRTVMFTRFYKGKEAGQQDAVKVSIWATPPGPNVAYFGRGPTANFGEYLVHVQDEALRQDRWLRRHCTHFLKVIIPRRPVEGVFKMNPFAP